MTAITFFLNKNILFNNFLSEHRRTLNILICFGFSKFCSEFIFCSSIGEMIFFGTK